MHASSTVSRTTAAYGLAVLFLTNVLNIADRTLLGVVTDPVRKELALTDTQMSIVSGFAFVLFNLVVGLLIAGWVDRGNRRLILAGGIALWSLATAMTGLATNFQMLAISRMLVGVGEATAFPVALSLISDMFRSDGRPRAVSIFLTSNFVGIVLGSILAGVLAAAHGWRWMFMAFGAFGLAVAALVLFTLVNPARGQADGQADAPDLASDRDPLISRVRQMFQVRGFALLSFGYGLSVMTVAVLPVWAPTFLLRSRDVPLAEVGAVIGPAVGIGGILGTLLSGVVATMIVKRKGHQAAALLVPLVALPLAAPAYAAFLFLPSLGAALVALGITNFLLASAIGPCVSIGVSIVPVNRRALASTLMLVAQSIVGMAIGPLIVGIVSDGLAASAGDESLRFALATMAVVPPIASLFLWLAYRRLSIVGGDRVARVAAASAPDPRPAPMSHP